MKPSLQFLFSGVLALGALSACNTDESTSSQTATDPSSHQQEQTPTDETGKKPQYLINEAPQPLPTSLAAALNRSWIVVSGVLGPSVSETELLESGQQPDLFYRYTWESATFTPDGVIQDTVTDALKSIAPNQESYPFTTDPGTITTVGFMYGPYDTARADGSENDEFKLAASFLQRVPEAPVSFAANTRVVLFLRPTQFVGLGTIYSVVHALPFDGDNVDATPLEDGSVVAAAEVTAAACCVARPQRTLVARRLSWRVRVEGRSGLCPIGLPSCTPMVLGSAGRLKGEEDMAGRSAERARAGGRDRPSDWPRSGTVSVRGAAAGTTSLRAFRARSAG